MGAMQQISVSKADAEKLRAKVAKGLYRTEADVVREALHALAAEEDRIEHWLHTEVVAAIDELRADPDRVFTAEQVRQRIDERRKQLEA